MENNRGMSTSPLFKTSCSRYRIERRDYCALVPLTYNASDTTTRLLRRASVELGEHLSMHPALRVSTLRMVKPHP